MRYGNTLTNLPFSVFVYHLVKEPVKHGYLFEDVFYPEDVLRIVKGSNDGDDSQANALYIEDEVSKNVEELISILKPITPEIIKEATSRSAFRIICRPVYPSTSSKTELGKDVYTRFVPCQVQKEKTLINHMSELVKLGTFYTVKPIGLKSKELVEDLKTNYNIFIPLKSETRKKNFTYKKKKTKKGYIDPNQLKLNI